MMANLSGKTALITGASVGIGRDLAEIFAADGHHLVIVARNRPQLEEAAAKLRASHGIKVEVIAKDLSVPGAGQEIFDLVTAKGITIEYLVNNAGFGTHGKFAESDMDSQLAMVQVNIAALVQLTRLFLPGMLGRKSGRIMQLASTAAYLPGPLMAVYYATKAFVLSFSEALDAEVSGTGVTVTTVCPGPTSTEFQKRAGIANSPLFRGNTMTSAQVAQIGYAAMMRGRRTVICGLKNRLMILASRFATRRMGAAVTYKLNQNR